MVTDVLLIALNRRMDRKKREFQLSNGNGANTEIRSLNSQRSGYLHGMISRLSGYALLTCLFFLFCFSSDRFSHTSLQRSLFIVYAYKYR